MDTVKVNLRLRGIKGPSSQFCFELPRGGAQHWVPGDQVVSFHDYNQLSKIVEVELSRELAEEKGWL